MKKYLKYFFIGIGLVIAASILYQLILTFLPDVKMYLTTVGETDKERILANVRSHGFSTSLLLILLMVVFSAIPGFPVSVVGVLSGVCFGPIKASFMNIVGVSVGNILTYFLIKKFKLVNKSSNRWLDGISESKHPSLYITLAFMIPFIPSFLINYTADSLKIDIKKFVWMVIIGSVPSSVLYAFGGDAVFKGNMKQSVLLIASVGLLTVLIVLFKESDKKKKAQQLD